MAAIRLFGLGGGGFSMEPENPLLDRYILDLCGKSTPHICFIPTASGDSESYTARFRECFRQLGAQTSVLSLFQKAKIDKREFLGTQDLIYVGGGSTVNLLALWRVHGLDEILREVAEAGVIIGGVSAGVNCWFQGYSTDSFGELQPRVDGLGWLPGSVCPHYDGEAERRPSFNRFIGEGHLPNGLGLDDGAGFYFEGERIVEFVASRPNARAWRVERTLEGTRETELETTYLGS